LVPELKKAAHQTYIEDVLSNEGTYLGTCFGIASGLLDAWYNGLDGLEQSVESATKSADDALRNAAKNADTTSDMITYLKKAAQADVDYAKALEANLGVYQKAWRQGICDGLSPTDPARGLWLTEIAFVSKVGDARNVYMTGLGNASMLYTNTTLDAYAVFNAACWTASDTYYNGMYGASSAYSSSMRSANYMYACAGFEADKSHTLAIFSAAKTEALADADYTIAKSNAAASKTASDSTTSTLDSLFSHLGTSNDFAAWLSEATATSATLTAFNSTETTARNARISNGNIQLGNLKSQNALTRKNTDAISDLVWHGAMETNSTNAMIMVFSATTTFLTTANSLGATYSSSIDTAYDTYMITEINAWNKDAKQANALNHAYKSAIEQLTNNPNFDAAGYISQVTVSQSSGGTGSEVQPLAGSGGNFGGDPENGCGDYQGGSGRLPLGGWHQTTPSEFYQSFCVSLDSFDFLASPLSESISHEYEDFSQFASPVAGAEIGDQIRVVLEKIEKEFNDLSRADKLSVILGTSSPVGWDIDELFKAGKASTDDWKFQNDIHNLWQKGFLPGSVTIDGNSYWAAEANYVLWGFAQRMFHNFLLSETNGRGVYESRGVSYYDLQWEYKIQVITIDSSLTMMELWRKANYGSRDTSDVPNPERRSPGSGITGRTYWTISGWQYYGNGPGQRGGFGAATLAKINTKATPNPHKSENLILNAYLGSKAYTYSIGAQSVSFESLI